MKRLLIISIQIFIFFYAEACFSDVGSFAELSGGKGPASTAVAAEEKIGLSLSSLERDALSRGQNYLYCHIVVCNGHTFFRAIGWESQVAEYGDVVSFVVEIDPLTKADKLNGVEWKGTVKANVPAYTLSRQWSYDRVGEWKDGREEMFLYSISLAKKNGVWVSGYGDKPVQSLKMLTCNDLSFLK